MINGLANNYSLANISGSLTTKAMTNAASSGSTSGNAGMNASNIGSTFLSLLTQELQNQDPTAPMDSTAMVGQMISLNSLSQLVSINQTLSNATGASSSSNTSAATQQQIQGTAPAAKDAAVAAIQAAASSTNPLSYLFPMNQIAAQGTSAANVATAQSALLSSPSAIR